MGLIEEKKQAKKAKILNSAYKLFTEKTLEATSISDIARHAGVAKGTFYLYFHDKYSLYETLVVSCSNEIIVKALRSIDQKTLSTDKDWVFAIMDNILDQMQEDPSMLSFIAKNLSWGIFKNALLSDQDSGHINMHTLFSSLVVEDGLLKYSDPELMIFMIIELVGSTSHSVILDESPTTLEHLKPYLYKTVGSIINMFYVEDVSKRKDAAEAGFVCPTPDELPISY
ncbi:MAG: TetR/AcrR family transcriptional regulator [Eubacterium sp.]|nr:TetR/AcrR family transcriptional regulator [Eubacterium sp.]